MFHEIDPIMYPAVLLFIVHASVRASATRRARAAAMKRHPSARS